MSNKTQPVIEALPDETLTEYDLRNKDEGLKKCLHNFIGQDNLRCQICHTCGCLNYNVDVNTKYDIYFDDYN